MKAKGQIYVTVSLGSGDDANTLRDSFYDTAEEQDLSFSKWAVRAMKKELETKK